MNLDACNLLLMPVPLLMFSMVKSVVKSVVILASRSLACQPCSSNVSAAVFFQIRP